MVDQSPSFFDFDDRMVALLAKGDDLERVKALVDFESWARMREQFGLSFEDACGVWKRAIDRLLPLTPPVS